MQPGTNTPTSTPVMGISQDGSELVSGDVVDGEAAGSPGGGVETVEDGAGSVVGGVVVVDCTVAWSDDEGHKVSGP